MILIENVIIVNIKKKKIYSLYDHFFTTFVEFVIYHDI